MKRLSRDTRIAIAIYFAALGAYAGASSGRLRVHTNDNHYVRLADCWLHGRLDLGSLPVAMDDRAQVETVWLKDGRVLRGALVSGTNQAFRTLKGEIIDVPPDVVQKREMKYYVSFPPFPAVLMLPFVAIWGLNTNDVLFNVLLAPIAPALLFLLLRRLVKRGDSKRTEGEDVWLTAVLGIGSVYYYTSVIGQVWYTAHVVAVISVVCYVHAALDAKRPFWAGLALVCGFGCRPEILFGAPLFLWELARVNARAESDEARGLAERGAGIDVLGPVGGLRLVRWALVPIALPLRVLQKGVLALKYGWMRLDKAGAMRGLVAFGVPIAVLGFAAAGLNIARFGRPTEFGHTYLQVRWTPRIQRFGLINYAFLGRNLACMLALTPRILAGPPWIQSSWHGLAIWVTTPAVLYLIWPKEKGPLHRPLWISVACVAVPSLMYQNSGWIQFGYRFALDYMVFLVVLLAIGARPMGRWFKLLILVGIAVNLFGAISFGRMPQFSYDGYFVPSID